MEAIVMGIVLKTAKRLGFTRESDVSQEAIETAILAVRDGRSIELSVELGEAVLARGMQPSAA